MEKFTKNSMKQAISDKLSLNFGCTVEEATDANMMKACAMVLRDQMSIQAVETRRKVRKKQLKQVHYMSLEFLMGRSLMKNAYNLGVLQPMREAVEEMGFKPAHIFDMEPDAGLGNGGLGRLAACYLDSLTTLEIPACGYSICYELGIFKQKIVDGQQMELPDNWKDQGDAWLIPRPDEVEEVHFGGTLREFWDGDRLHVVNEDYTKVLAVPCDMSVAGYDTTHTNTLRLWDAKSPTPIDMSAFNQGDYLRAGEEKAMAEAIAKVLYPEDNHYEGKSLRLRQQYFFVSATVQSIVRKHIQTYHTLTNFHEKNVIQINDTHPALVIPELMRILMDDAGLDWETSWNITVNSVAYTNHTVLAEALERWPQTLMQTLLPRIWQILCEIARRWQAKATDFYCGDESKVKSMAVIWDGEVRMANLCIAGGMAVNGVSALHSDILRRDVFREACKMEPHKFKNVTNGIDHRRWLAEINPGLDKLICDLTGGSDYLHHPGAALPKLDKFASDKEVLLRLEQIKQANKAAFAKYAKRAQGFVLNTDAIFDVQVKRLHEYKRQLLNVMHIIHIYNQLRDNPNMDFRPHTFLFGAKAAPGYAVAKRIIHLINSLADQINNDPVCKDKLQVFFLENYRVSMAEVLMPASEVSQQISTAGKEASGTGNMKFMMNGALTVGTLDGANVEMHEVLGDENMFLFGLKAEEVKEMRDTGYNPFNLYSRDPNLHRILDQMGAGFRDGVRYDDLVQRLLMGGSSPADEYMLLADFASYCAAERRMVETYADRKKWNQMSLHNIARSGIFAADRSIADYAETIWHVPYKK
ncbi:MAG: glycogen/starch/alpha-glucan phosphorylase [Oscillospiraceae bacterium]|jgi:starch phosphorylase|nr:glycogen/starch/alpha-glucan phosphorylase [Oscillospiraceae bacterium]